MKQQCAVDGDALNRAGAMFAEISLTAYNIKRLASMLGGDSVTAAEDVSSVLASIEALAERAGMLADLGSRKCGGGLGVGGVVEWTMPHLPSPTPKG